jgi:glycosyltransferase involved in cell wall biosynthesis
VSWPATCIVAHAHPSFSKGGGETAAYRQFETMRAAGAQVYYVCAAEAGAQAEGGRLLAHAPREVLYDPRGMSEDRLFWSDLGARDQVLEHLVSLPVATYHFHHVWRVGLDLIAALMDARPDARFVVTLHEMLAICAHHGQMVRTKGRELCQGYAPALCASCFPDQTPRHFALRRATYLALLQRFEVAIYPSHFIRDRFQAWGLKSPHEMVLENYLGDEHARFPRIAQPDGARGTDFAFFGQPTPFKGLDVLLRGFALALKQDPRLSLAVFGCEREDVVRMFPTIAEALESAGSSVFFSGRYDQADVLDLMQTCGWVVVPSIWWENSPLVIQEALRAGVPLIVSNVGGMAEKVRPGVDGLQFKRGNPLDLSRVLVAAAASGRQPSLTATMADSIGREAYLTGLAEALGMAAAIEQAPDAAQAGQRPASQGRGRKTYGRGGAFPAP